MLNCFFAVLSLLYTIFNDCQIKNIVRKSKKTIKKLITILGIKITKVIACIPPANCKMDIVLGSTNVMDYNEITGTDVSNVLLDAIKGQDFTSNELVTAMPISFTVDDKTNIKDY